MKYTLVGCNLYMWSIGKSSPVFFNGTDYFMTANTIEAERVLDNRFFCKIDPIVVDSSDWGMENFDVGFDEIVDCGNPKCCVMHFDKDAQSIFGKEEIQKLFVENKGVPVSIEGRNVSRNDLVYFVPTKIANSIFDRFFEVAYSKIKSKIVSKEWRITDFNVRGSDLREYLDILSELHSDNETELFYKKASSNCNVHKGHVLLGAIKFFNDSDDSFDHWAKITCMFQYQRKCVVEETENFKKECIDFAEQLLKGY